MTSTGNAQFITLNGLDKTRVHRINIRSKAAISIRIGSILDCVMGVVFSVVLPIDLDYRDSSQSM